MPGPVAFAGLAVLVAVPLVPLPPAGPGVVLEDVLTDGAVLVVDAALLLGGGALLAGALVDRVGDALLDGAALLLEGGALLLDGALELGRLEEVLPAAEVGTEPIGATEVADRDGVPDTGCRLLPLDTDCPGNTPGFFEDEPFASTRPPAARAAITAAPATRAPTSGPRPDRRSSYWSSGVRWSTWSSDAGGIGARPAAGM